MSEILQHLEDNLRRQVALYDELNTLESHKQKSIINSKLQELEAITLREEQLLLEASHLEKERLLWAEQIGRDLGQAPEELTLAELAKHYPMLQGVRFELDRTVNALQAIHEINAELLKQAMKVVEFTVSMLTHQDKRTYNHPTNHKEDEVKPKLHLLDRRV
ncbi:flagellar biosynthesis protein FlgN [Desulfosporosinus sp. HMP52]|uniref:flagellar protein FlgN n=1 Tax=Desulfosporosinus sp. HMP52 TaxID=1487923 RepID=UPI00051FCF4D|nr:flagellar protein FlgN [Desulfosporosinus sp. HMP52]KGK90333.1 flagellar biosynthesis protein FlgN [Desulfosporosinus sp. HMP52]